jgi:hypothetical protein
MARIEQKFVDEELDNLIKEINNKAKSDVDDVYERNKKIDLVDKIQLKISLKQFYVVKLLIEKENYEDFTTAILLEGIVDDLETFSKKYEDINILKKLTFCYNSFIARQHVFFQEGILNKKTLDKYIYRNHEIEKRIRELENLGM